MAKDASGCKESNQCDYSETFASLGCPGSPAFDSTTYVKEAIERLNKSGKGLNDLTGIVDRDEHQYIGGGTFGDVYKGIWRIILLEQDMLE